MLTYNYGEKEIAYLKSQDEVLGQAIERLGQIHRKINPNPFEALISSVIAQQVSIKGAETVYQRLSSLALDITPKNIGKLSLEEIQGCGMTFRKAGYIKGISEAALSGQVDFKGLHELSDQEVIEKLMPLKGIGLWTIEMLLIHALSRPDVVSYGDLAIRKGMMHLYGLETLSKATFDGYRKTYSPYGTVASLYLWALSLEA